jgi:endogenous inhibitor of DNA gyrase (YacG/DUF329 family)
LNLALKILAFTLPTRYLLVMNRPCPICKQPAEFSEENPFRPFCSERCKLVDLGKWLNEDYAIPGESLPAIPDEEKGVY